MTVSFVSPYIARPARSEADATRAAALADSRWSYNLHRNQMLLAKDHLSAWLPRASYRFWNDSYHYELKQMGRCRRAMLRLKQPRTVLWDEAA